MSPLQRKPRQSIVCEAETKKKADSAAKRARQSEKRRLYHKARKSEFRTRMKKVMSLSLSFFRLGFHHYFAFPIFDARAVEADCFFFSKKKKISFFHLATSKTFYLFIYFFIA